MSNRKRAIEYIKHCRNIHQHWIKQIRKGKKSKIEKEIGGGICWHSKWVKRYNFVIKELKK